MSRLILELDHIEWDQRSTSEILAEITATRPLWLRVANFYQRTLEILDRLPPSQLVLWRVEYWGRDKRFPQVPSSDGVDLISYANQLMDLGHRIVPYTYLAWNRQYLIDLVPPLAGRPFHLLPVAQKPTAPVPDRAAVRDALELPRDAFVYGVGGLNHPAKRIEEVIAAFVRSCPEQERWLLVSLIDEDCQTADDIAAQWTNWLAPADLSRVRIRVGQYGQWEWMCEFYRAVDVLMVNSLCESWCRMVSEALGFATALLVRRAPCASNHVAPDAVLVDDFENLSKASFEAAIGEAQRRAKALQQYVQDNFALPVVREMCLRLMRSNTPPHDHAVFDRLTVDHDQLALLDSAIVY